jgi:hypothetical protein
MAGLAADADLDQMPLVKPAMRAARRPAQQLARANASVAQLFSPQQLDLGDQHLFELRGVCDLPGNALPRW